MIGRDEQINQTLRRWGWSDVKRDPVAGDASARRYERLLSPDGSRAILMDAPPDTGEDVRPFAAIAKHLRAVGLSAPEIFHCDETAGLLLIEDFGDALFADLIARDQAQEIPLYRAAADVLIHLQSTPTPSLALCDADWLTHMTAPLFEWYTKDFKAQTTFGVLFHPFAAQAAQGKPVMILRDYHAQNLLLLPERTGVERVGLLDFQDAMLGHPAYDLVSILQDARRDVSPDVEATIKQHMQAALHMDRDEFDGVYAILGLQRNLRILGIFARLSLRDGKAQYVDLIPRVWGYIQRNLAHPTLGPLATFLNATLPAPTPEFLEHLKTRCPISLSP